MRTKKKSAAMKFLESLTGGALTFGELLESTRRCKGMSQVDLARKMGVSRSRLCDIEKGRRPVMPEMAVRFAKVLGYSVNQFVSLALEDQIRGLGLNMRVELRAA